MMCGLIRAASAAAAVAIKPSTTIATREAAAPILEARVVKPGAPAGKAPSNRSTG